MNARREFRLTSSPNGGYLFPLFPLRRMDRDQTLSAEQASLEFSPPRSASERLNQRRSLSALARLARSTRGKIGAALLALGGGAVADNRADAATMLQGQVVENVYGEQSERIVALDNTTVRLMPELV